VDKAKKKSRGVARPVGAGERTRPQAGSAAESTGISNHPLGEERERQTRLPARGTKQRGERPRGGTTSGTRKKRGRGET
jgi:hypothetical protein